MALLMVIAALAMSLFVIVAIVATAPVPMLAFLAAFVVLTALNALPKRHR